MKTTRLWAAVAVVGAVFLIQYSLYFTHSRDLPLGGAVSEYFLWMDTGERFDRCGFFRTALLPDYSISGRCGDRPIVYTHMPSLPGVAVGLLRRAGLREPGIRIPFAMLTLAGLALFVVFCAQVCGSAAVAAAAGLYLLCSLEGFMVWSDHLVHSFFWLSYFGSMAVFLRRGNGRAAQAAGIACLLLGTSCLFIFGAAVLATQTFFALADRQPARWKRAGASFLAVSLFLAALAARNAAYLGPRTALKDIVFTVSNRIWAVPPVSELAGFYRSHGIVLWGAENVLDRGLARQFDRFFLEFRAHILILLFFAAAGCRSEGFRSPSARMLGAAVGLFSWFAVFQAHGQYYQLSYLTRAAQALLLAGCAAEILRWTAAISRRDPSRFLVLARTSAAVLLLALFGAPAWDAVEFGVHPLADAGFARAAAIASELASLRSIPAEETVWSNMGSLELRHLTRALPVGSCRAEAFRKRRLDSCYGRYFFDGTDAARRAASPSYFFLSAWENSGSLDCDGRCVERLAKDVGRGARLAGGGRHTWLFKL